MKRPDYLNRYLFDWDLLEVVLGGKSALDAKSFVSPLTSDDQIEDFLDAYGFSQGDPILKAETFGTFQESMQFIRRYFLKEGNEEGLDLEVPPSLYSITEVKDVFRVATGAADNFTYEESLWAQVVLKVMHTILHADKDLRYNYFSQIQQQVFDRFYKYLSRDGDNKLYLGAQSDPEKIPLQDFETKSKKSRDSIIIKLLHKAENVAEELFDRIGVRFITANKLDCLRVVKFLYHMNVIVIHNIKPSRSRNTLIDINDFKRDHHSVLRMALRNELSEDRFQQALIREMKAPHFDKEDDNQHSFDKYSAIQFTGRHLIRYRNPFLDEFRDLRKMAKERKDGDPLTEKILSLDPSLISRDVRFFYPFEVQIVDEESHSNNMEGEASHQDYKKSQLKSAMNRIFEPLIKFKNLS